MAMLAKSAKGYIQGYSVRECVYEGQPRDAARDAPRAFPEALPVIGGQRAC